jgi:hypothetical protein
MRSSYVRVFLALVLCLACAPVVLLGGGGRARAAAPASCPSTDKTVDYNCPVGPTYLIPGLTDLAGWSDPSHYLNILAGDINGDGQDEIVARGVGGIEVYRFDTSTGQWSQVVVNPILSDAQGWGLPQYYRTIQLVRIFGPAEQLVARSPAGVVVYEFDQGNIPDTGTWQQLTTSGPMSDKDCFTNNKCWGDDPSYYSTIQVGDLGGSALVGRGADGLETYFWNGSGWDKSATLSDLSDANGWNTPDRYTSIHIWSNGEMLLARGHDGMLIYQPISGPPASWQKLGTNGPFADTDCFTNGNCWSTGPQYWSTIQFAPNRFSGNPIVFGRGGDGVEIYVASPTNGGAPWTWESMTTGKPADSGAPFSDAAGFNKPQYYATVQAANVRGTPGEIDLLGRGTTGMVTYELDQDQFKWSAPVSSDQPALADDPWGSCACYYDTIQTLDAAGMEASALVARDAHGLRTWRFDISTSTWTRFQPYGAYPSLDPAAFAALNSFLGITNGTVRDVYTYPGSSPTADQLAGYQSSIAGLCTGELSASPPTFQTCTPPQGSTVPAEAWTTVSNQILAELYWARQVVDHFFTLGEIQKKLFLDQNSEFPSLAGDLKLGQLPGTITKANYLGLFGGFVNLLAQIPIPGLQQVFQLTGSALAIAGAATPSLDGSEPTVFDHTFAQIQTKIASVQQEAQDELTAHQRYVLGDYGLLRAVGRLVASQVWKLDEQAALSASRQSFTLWLYQAFLPVVWDRWTVHGCDTSVLSPTCNPPPNGPGMNTYTNSNGVVDFDGLVPRQTPCVEHFQFICTWTDLKTQGYDTTYSTLTQPVAPACTYDPTAGTSWRYGPCTLGVSPNDLFNPPTQPPPWPFRSFACTVQNSINVSECVRVQPTSVIRGDATGLGTRNASVDLKINLPRPGSLDLHQVKVTIARLLNEGAVTGAGELVNRPTGADATPLTLTQTSSPSATTGPNTAVLTTSPGDLPQVLVLLTIHRGSLIASIHVSRISTFDAPRACAATTQTTHLGTQLIISDGTNQPVQVLSTAPWRCVTQPNGTVRRLQLGRVS